VVAIVAVVAAAIVAVVLLTGSNSPDRISVKSAVLRGKLEAIRHLSVKKTRTLADRTAGEVHRLERRVLGEQEGPPVPVDREAPPVKRSDVPPTARVPQAKFPTATSTLVDTGSADFTAEPDVARNGTRVLATWNWGSALSRDGGRTFLFQDPFRQFQRPAFFCCDQVVLHDKPHDLWIWVVQWLDGQRHLRERLLTAKGDAGFDAPNGFTGFDLAPSDFGYPSDCGLDYPHIATTDGNLFLSVNVYGADARRTAGNYEGTVVARLPLDKLATAPEATYYRHSVGPVVLTRGASKAMYFAAHKTNAELRVWRWPDDADHPDYVDVPHDAFSLERGTDYECPRAGAAASSDWCRRSNARPEAGWVANGELGFAWNAQQDPARGFPYPYVMVARIDESSMKATDTSPIASSDRAYQYPAIAPDPNGNLGGVILSGGGSQYQSCDVLYRGAGDSKWIERPIDTSDADQSDAKSGDYLGSGFDTATNTWAAGCMTLHGGSGPKFVGIRFVSFAAP